MYRRRAVAAIFKTQNDLNGMNLSVFVCYWILRTIYVIRLFMRPSKWHVFVYMKCNGKMLRNVMYFWRVMYEYTRVE